MQVFDTIVGLAKKLTEVGVALIALAIVAQVLFGAEAAFIPGDVVGNITNIFASLGGQGLVGLAA
ncbi:MAG: hypothetical protein CME26_00005, partial [Gemmatimonadetes bacterium]|nr:hypothetical protein [Gemmatimonadota bacterium]